MYNFGLIGYPVKDSLSPFLHSSFFSSVGLVGGYNGFPVQDAMSLPVVINFLERFSFTGLNITAPHKETVISLAYDHSDTVKKLGAANTLHYGKDGWVAHNTDVQGFSHLLNYHNIAPSGGNVLVLGAGGSAKAVVMALSQKNVNSITIVNRKEERAARLADIFTETRINYSTYEGLKHSDGFDIVINTLPVDWTSSIWRERFWPQNEKMLDIRTVKVVIDLRCVPWETDFLSMWQGVKKYNGFCMLVEQAAASFEIWTGLRPDYSVKELIAKLYKADEAQL